MVKVAKLRTVMRPKASSLFHQSIGLAAGFNTGCVRRNNPWGCNSIGGKRRGCKGKKEGSERGERKWREGREREADRRT